MDTTIELSIPTIKKENENMENQDLSDHEPNGNFMEEAASRNMASEAGPSSVQRNFPLVVGSLSQSMNFRDQNSRSRSPVRSSRKRSRSPSLESSSRSPSSRYTRLLTEAEFQQRTLEFQHEMMKMQKKTIHLLEDIKHSINKETPGVSQIQESLATIQDHEKEKSYLLLDGNSSHSYAVSDGQMEHFENQQHHSPPGEPPEHMPVNGHPSFGWQSPLSNILSPMKSILPQPLDSLEDLRTFDDSLKDNNEKMILLVQQFFRLSAPDCKEFVKLALRSIMKKSLMEKLNMEGQRSETSGKYGFKSSILCNAIVDAALLRFSESNRVEVLNHIKFQLRYSKRLKAWN